MLGFIIFLHVVVSLGLIIVILMQSGRGGGLTEAFSSAESMFGAKTNDVLIKGTTIFAVLFLITSLSLAFISSRQGKSLMTDGMISEDVQETANQATEEGQQALKNVAQEAQQAVPEEAGE